MPVNWEHNVLETDGPRDPMQSTPSTRIPTEEVRAVKTYVIPASTEMVIEGQLGEGTRTLSTGMLTGLPRFMGKRQLGVAAILARRRGRIVPVRVSTRVPGREQWSSEMPWPPIRPWRSWSHGSPWRGGRSEPGRDQHPWPLNLEDLYEERDRGT